MIVSIYQFSATTAGGEQQSLSNYQGNVLLIVNTASNCGFTSQYQELQQLYEKYGKDNFTVLAFPCNQFLKLRIRFHACLRSPRSPLRTASRRRCHRKWVPCERR